MPKKQAPQAEVLEEAPLEEDEDGFAELSLTQKQVLRAVAGGKSPTVACEECGVSIRTWFRWQHQHAFTAALDSFFSRDDIANLKKTLNIAAQGTVDVYDEAMRKACKQVLVHVTCPSCATAFDSWATVEDWKARLHAADMLLKVAGLVLERKESKVDITVGYRLTMAEQLALLKWERGQFELISPQLESRLRELGKIGDKPLLTDGRNESVDASFIVLEGSNDTTDPV